MNSNSYLTKKKNSNDLLDLLLMFDKNTKHLKNVVEWHFNNDTYIHKYEDDSSWRIVEDCFYITENHQIIIKKSAIQSGKAIFILKLDRLINTMNEAFKIIPEKNKSDYLFISLNQFLYDYKILFVVNDSDINLYANKELRKLNYCINCNKCFEVCPINLVQPNFSPVEHIKSEIKNYGYVKNQLCLGCGKCDSACPVGIPLSYYFLFFNKPKKWKEKYFNLALNNKHLAKFVDKII